jgi:hypothetical protein
MIELLYYGCPLIAVGGVAGLLSDNVAEVLSAQATFLALQLIGVAVGKWLRRRRNGLTGVL